MQNSNRNCSHKAESGHQLEKRTTWKHFWIEFKRKIISTKIEKPAAKTPFATLQMETIAQRQQRHKKKSPGSLNSNGNAVRHKFDGKATMAETAAHASQLFSAIEPPFADKTPCFVQILTFKSHSNHITDVALNAIWAQRLAKHNRTATNNAKTHPTTFP